MIPEFVSARTKNLIAMAQEYHRDGRLDDRQYINALERILNILLLNDEGLRQAKRVTDEIAQDIDAGRYETAQSTIDRLTVVIHTLQPTSDFHVHQNLGHIIHVELVGLQSRMDMIRFLDGKED